MPEEEMELVEVHLPICKNSYRRCVYCGDGRARVQVLGGWAHRYCVDGKPKPPVMRLRPKRK